MQTLEDIKTRLSNIDREIAELEHERRSMRKQAKRILADTATQFGIEVELADAPKRRRRTGITPLGKTSPDSWKVRARACLEKDDGLTFGKMKTGARLNAQQLSIALKSLEADGVVRKNGKVYFMANSR